jgi:hypothetical protein
MTKQALEKAREALPWDGVNLDGMLEALTRLNEGYYHTKNPFHSPIWDDAALAQKGTP